MKRTRSFRLVAAGVVVALTSAVAVTTTTQTVSANDLSIIQANLDDALGVLLTGFSEAAETYLASQSAELLASDVLGEALRDAAIALVAGTDQFAGLDYGLTLFYQALKAGLDPFIAALDDPAAALDLFTADDLSTLLSNLVPAATFALGLNPLNSEFGCCGVIQGIAQLLQGRIIGPTSLEYFQPTYFFGDVFFGVTEALYMLGNYEFDSPLVNLSTALTFGSLIAGAGLEGLVGVYLVSAQAQLQPLLTGELAAVTGPLAALLTGFSLPALPLPLP